MSITTIFSQPVVSRFSDAEQVHAFGDLFHFLLNAEHTDGALEAGIDITQPGGGPPLHIHTYEDEIFWILEGTYEFTVGNARHTATPGTLVFAPRYVPHTFRCISKTPGKQLVLTCSGNFVTFFRRCAEEFATGAPDFGKIMAISTEHGLAYPSLEEAAQYKAPTLPQYAKVLQPESGEKLEIAGTIVRYLLNASETGGNYGLIHLETPSGLGPSLHAHEHEDELFLIQSGEYEFNIGGETVRVGPGDAVWGPRESAHSFRVVSDEPGTMLVMYMPGGFEHYFRRIGEEVASHGLRPELIKEVYGEFGLEALA